MPLTPSNCTRVLCTAQMFAALTLAVAVPRVGSATPVTSAANIPNSAISPGGVNLATGELILVLRPDLKLGGPMPIAFDRYYASMLTREGLASARMGPNWLGTFDWKLTVSGTTADVITNRGKDVRFTRPQAGGPWSLASPLDQAYMLSLTGGTYRFTDPTSRLIYSFTGSLLLLTQITDEHGNSLSLTYSAGRLMQVSDGMGRALSFAYDPFAGMLVSVGDGTRSVVYSYTGGTLTGFTDAAGQHWTYSYLTPAPFNGLLIGAGEPVGNTPLQNSYDALGRVLSQSDAAGGVANYGWDGPTGSLFIDPLGRTWTYLHDAQSRLISLTDPNSQPWSRGYDAVGRLAREMRPLGDVTSYSYDAASGYPARVGFADGTAMLWNYSSHGVGGSTFFDLSSIQYPDLSTETFTRDAAGNPTSTVDRGGFPWQATFNARGQVLTATNPSTGVTTFSYDAGGRLASAQDPAGNVTRYTYDALSRLIALAPDDTSSKSWAYDALDRVTSTVDGRGKVRSYGYDANGRLTSATDPLLETTHYSYDALDRPTQVNDPLGNTTSLTYDPQGQVASMTDGTTRAMSCSYNVWGDFAGLTDPAGASWTYAYDSNRRVTLAQDPLGHSSQYAYDAVDRLTHLTAPVGTGFDYSYDTMDRLLSETGPLGFSHTYSYDARGQMRSAHNAASEYDFARDPLGNMSQFTDPDRNVSPYSYDSGGRLTMTADPLERPSACSYDARGRLSHVTLPVNSGDLTYDGADRLRGASITGGTSLSFNYDDADRMTGGNGAALGYDAAGSMISSNGLSLTYDAAGRIASETYSPGRVVSYSYDARGALSRVTDWLGGVTTLSYDAAGNLTGITRPNGTSGSYAYDAAGRLANAGERQPGPTGSSISSISITRDALEQPTAVERSAPLLPGVQSPGTTNFAYDLASQVSGPTWDGQGRLLGDGSRTLVWDGASRLISYTAPGQNLSFTYDSFGRMLSRTQGAVSEQYEWNYANGSPTLDVVMNAGTPVRYFVHTPSGLLLESIEAAGGARRYYHYDENGNTIFLTDDSGAVVAEYAYGPYGDVRSSGATSTNPFTLGALDGAIQLTDDGIYYFFNHEDGKHTLDGGVYDTKYARIVSGGAIASGGFGLSQPPEPDRIGLPKGFAAGAVGGPGSGGLGSCVGSILSQAGSAILDNGRPTNGLPDNGIPDNGIPNSGIPNTAVNLNHVGSFGMPSGGENVDAVDAFIWFEDTGGMRAPGGETKDDFFGHSKIGAAFELKDFSFGVENPTTIGSATGGAGAGKIKFNEFTIKKATDKASPLFFKNCCAGSHYKNVTIELRKAGPDPKSSSKPFLRYHFQTVFTTKIDWSGPGDEGPEESITFVYGSVKIDYQPQNAGSAGVIHNPGLVFGAAEAGLKSALNGGFKSAASTSTTSCVWCHH